MQERSRCGLQRQLLRVPCESMRFGATEQIEKLLKYFCCCHYRFLHKNACFIDPRTSLCLILDICGQRNAKAIHTELRSRGFDLMEIKAMNLPLDSNGSENPIPMHLEASCVPYITAS